MSSPPAITAFEFSHHRRDSKDSTTSEPPQSISQVTESTRDNNSRETDADRRKYDDFDDYVPVNVTDGDGEAQTKEEEKEAYARRLMEDLTWAFECR